jgi:hypothetical protein
MEWKEEKKIEILYYSVYTFLIFFYFFKPFVFVSFPRKTVEKIHETGNPVNITWGYIRLHSI